METWGISSFQYHNEIEIAASFIRKHLGVAEVAIVLGSGLTSFTEKLTESKALGYSRIPSMPQTTVKGHDGSLILGHLRNKNGPLPCLCFSGRVHWYEGYGFARINFFARLAAALGCKLFVLTNSAGGCLEGMKPGGIMIIRDCIRWTNVSPMIDICDDERFGSRLFSAREMFSSYMGQLVRSAGKKVGIRVHEGVYCWTTGPSYETPAEVNAGRTAGAGAFGMSTCPEVIAARAIGMEVFGISLCTNLAAGIESEKLLHSDVTKVAKLAGPQFETLLIEAFYNADVSQISSYKLRLREHPAPSSGETIPHVDRHRPDWSSEADITRDAELVRLANTDQRSPTVAIFLCEGQSSHVFPLLSDMRSVPFSDFVHLKSIAHSKSCRQGIITVSTFNSMRVCIVHGLCTEGLHDFECHHIISVLSMIGVNTVAFLLPAVRLKVSASPDSSGFIRIVDVIDRTRSLTCPWTNFVYFENGSSPHNLLSRIPLPELDSAAGEESIIEFPGPTLPFAAEINMFKSLKCSMYTITNMSPIKAAAAIGLRTFAFACACERAEEEQFIQLIKARDGKRKWTLLIQSLASQARTSQASQSPMHLRKNRSLSVLRIPRLSFKQESYNSVEAAGRYLQLMLGPEIEQANCAIFVEHCMGEVMATATILSFVHSKDIPGWLSQEGCGSGPLGERWQIQVVKLNTKVALVFRNDHSEYIPTAGTLYSTGFPTRIANYLGVKSIVQLGNAASVDPSIVPNSLAIFCDHINLSGNNPLFGPNVAGWGERFPDMSEVYSGELQNAAKTRSESEGLHVKTAVAAYVNNIFIDSAAEAEFVRSIGGKVICSGMIPQATIAVHMDMRVFALAFITHSAGHKTSCERFSQIDESLASYARCMLESVLAIPPPAKQPVASAIS